MSINQNNLSDLEEIARFEQAVQTFFNGHIDADRFTAIRLHQGVYGQRQQGVNMLRIKVPGGRLNADQLDALADVVTSHSQKNIAHITTRQSIQIHFIPLAEMPAAMRRLAPTGLTTREACGNTVRNMSACSLAGVCPREHVDIGTYVDGATEHFLRNPLNQQMPRKMKMSFSGCEADCAQSLLHDIGVIAVKQDGKNGFKIKSGGGLGHKPREAIVVAEFVPERELLFAIEALVTLHNKYSDRTKRAKSRIKFLVERFGEEGFITKYREEFERTRIALAQQPYPQGEWRVPTGNEHPGPGAPRKVFAQRQAGLVVLPISVALGEITDVQLHALAAALRVHGLNEVHTTQDQNIAIINVAEAQVESLRAALAAAGLNLPQTGDSVVACPGAATCRLGITSSTIVAPKLSGGIKDLRIRVSGCHNGCAQPETGDIGIYGEGKRLHGRLVPHYQMYFGGCGMSHGALALKGPAVPAARVETAIAKVAEAHVASGEANFFDWVRAQDEAYFKTLLADVIEVKEEEAASVMRDHGDEGDFRVLNLGGGECAGASQVMIGANFFEAAHEREYRNALVFQRKYAEAAHCNVAILRLLGGGIAQLLGGVRLDKLELLAEQLRDLVPGAVSDEFARLTSNFAQPDEISDADLAILNQEVDAWTRLVGAYATEHDEQLDLSEALPAI
ncbi:Sulfite reductase [ferredoxin] [Ferriphaselus amnicola]|uniref:Sulfite reductase [ferredoxin] n=1 Tax=Ferriphaselus amnicola TaxID=1188319 RepID=A0A2Z6GBD1_9PROT|nr:nitrite/sulfite reductase [Ferriphaselus amnicola]BBE50766.1 Sulfite reductase [ferredoxin] [Ferriphaselus amnicola]